ncbi:hypothetical protein Bca4012_006289 [Brassica carinata]|uniref:BnaCnng33480D protein n=3 Tax=Brassica TaxID=3705 RepID=A0A078J3Z9_BRANA|nr:hypothetical protein Bca52824_039507 [Brassica carinata]CDY58637.1 BnaCnng33480D [Brassica napus]VDC96722.1 unnamed protein product [Brassica oleracea]
MSESGNFVAANSESIISSSLTKHGIRCDSNLTANPVRVWTRKNPGRRFLSCRGRRVGRDYVKCDFCQWFDLEPPHGWQHLSLLEARDIINEQKEEISKLRNQVSKQPHQNSHVQISNDLVEQLNDKSEECEALKRAVLVLTERSSVLCNVLVASSVGFVVVLGGIIGFNFKV